MIKRLVVLLVTLIPLIAASQTVSPQGATNQVNFQRGGNGADTAMVIPIYADTTKANNYPNLRKEGRIIVTRTPRYFWFNDSQKWVNLGAVGSGLTWSDTTVLATKADLNNLIASLDTANIVTWQDTVSAVATKSDLDSSLPWIDARKYGVRCDSVTDDEPAINMAYNYVRAIGRGIIIMPTGRCMIGSTLNAPTNSVLLGQGRGATEIMNLPSAVLDTITPLYGTVLYPPLRWRAMWATDAADQNSGYDSVENVFIKDMTLNWNNLNENNTSVSAVMMGRARNSWLDNVAIPSVLPANLTGRKYGNCVQFSFSENCGIRNSYIGSADYESVSAWFLSKNIFIDRTVFEANKPYSYLTQVHCIQLARPSDLKNDLLAQYGEYIPGPLYVTNCTFLGRQNVGDFICSHFGEGLHTSGNTYEVGRAATVPIWGIKVFDSSYNFSIDNETFNYQNHVPINGQLPVLISVGTFTGATTDVFNGSITNNNAYINNLTGTITDKTPLIGGYHNNGRNILIANNTVAIDTYANRAYKVFAAKGSGINIQGNTTRFLHPTSTIDTSGPINVYVNSIDDINVSNNLTSGDTIGKGVMFDPATTVNNALLVGNNSPNARIDITRNHPNQDKITIIENQTLQQVTRLGNRTVDSVYIDSIQINGNEAASMLYIGTPRPNEFGNGVTAVGHNIGHPTNVMPSTFWTAFGYGIFNGFLGVGLAGAVGIGKNAGANIVAGAAVSNSIFVGPDAGAGSDGVSNVMVGNAAGNAMVTGYGTYIGIVAGMRDTSGPTSYNTGVGAAALFLNKGKHVTGLGDSTAVRNTYSYVTAIGTNARPRRDSSITFAASVLSNRSISIPMAYIKDTITIIPQNRSGTWALKEDTIAIANGGTGQTALGTANQLFGVNAANTGTEWKSSTSIVGPYIATGNGTSSAPAIQFGSTGHGFYQSTSTAMGIRVAGGGTTMEFGATSLRGVSAGRAEMSMATASSASTMFRAMGDANTGLVFDNADGGAMYNNGVATQTWSATNNVVFGGSLRTVQPSVNGAGLFKIGKVITGGPVTISTTTFLEVEIDGVIYKLAIVN